MPRLSADAVRDALLRPSREVRDTALSYFAEAYSPDPAVMPAVIRAVEQYGWDEAFGRRYQIANLAQTPETVRWVVDRLRQTPPREPGEFDPPGEPLIRILLTADADLLRDHEAEILALPALGDRDREAVRDRVALLSVPPDELWRRLEEACRGFDALDDYPPEEDVARADRLADALGRHPDAGERVLTVLRETAGQPDNWLELYAVRAARHLRLAAAVPLLVDRLHEDDDAMLEEAHPALSAIGSDEAVGLIRAAWPRAEHTFRFMATFVLENIHTDRSVEAALALAESEQDRGVKYRLYGSALMNFSPDAVDPARRELLTAGADMDARELRYALLAAAELMNERFPEYERWKLEETRARERAARRVAEYERGVEPEREKPIPPMTVVREEVRVGRNDPCPCGSGKKFKKCCGANR